MNSSDSSDRFFGQPGSDSGRRSDAAPVGRRRTPIARWLRLALVGLTLAAVVGGLLFWGLGMASAASDGYTYFPSPSTTDGRMLVIAGDMSTLSGSTVTVSFSVPGTGTTFPLGFFDGNASSGWDVVGGGLPLDTNFIVYADPNGNGSGTTMVAQFTSGSMAANAWTDFSVTNTQTALAPSGRYFYYMRASTTVANRQSYNAFKMRVGGTTYITPLNTFGFIAANHTGVTTAQTYDGTFRFYVDVPQGKTNFDLWDGDADRNGDTDDPNTSNSGIPTWSVPAARPEGINQGAPADDGGAQASYTRSPDVFYDVFMPDGTAHRNDNPSGNQEWELYRLGVSAAASPTPDVTVTSVPAGLWHVDFQGLDVANLVALRFDSPVLGVDASGTIVRPQFPFRLGDRVWLDADRNGAQESVETSIGTGVILALRDGAGSLLTTTAADANGYYSFTTLPGTFTVDVNDPANYASGGPLAGLMATTPRMLASVITTANNFNLDFGFSTGPALVVTKALASVSSTTAAVGEDTTYTVTVRNVGETTATSIVVTDTIVGADMAYVAGSSAATYTGGTSNANPLTPDSSTLTWDFGASSKITGGASLTLTYRLRVRPGAARGTHPDTVAVAAKDASGTPVAPDGHTWIAGDTDPDDSASASVWVVLPQLGITKTRTSADTTIQAGQSASFTIVVRNTGDSRVATLPVTDTFPRANLRYASALPSPSGVASGSLSWANVGPLDAGQQTTITVSFDASSAPAGSLAVDTAMAGPGIDVYGRAVPAASATASVGITRPHLTVTKTLSSSDATVQAGQGATFTVVVRNDGDTRIGGASLTDLYQNAYLTCSTATPAPAQVASSLTTYAVSTSNATGVWANAGASLGAPDSVVASTDHPPFEMWHSFAFPAAMTAIDEATITVRSRAGAGFGSTYAVSVDATATKDPLADPAMPRGTIDAGTTYANLAVSDSVYLTLRENNNGNHDVAASFASTGLFVEAADTAVNRIVVTAEGHISNGTEAHYVRFWDYSTGAWSTVWYQLGSTAWTTTEATYAATVTNTTAIQDYLDNTGAYQVQFADNDYRAGTDDGTRSRVYLDYLRVAFGYTSTTTTPRDDTWAIQYSTDAGSSWADVIADRSSPEATLTDHALGLSGLLTSANAANFRVRIRGSVVSSADGTGSVDWDASRLALLYKHAASNGSLSWGSLGGLDPGQQTTVTVSFVASASPTGLSTVDTATTGATTDVNGDAVSSAAGTAAVAITRPALAISKTLAPSQPATAGIGAPVRFQVLVTNTGNTTITAASVVDTWSPTYLGYVSAIPAATSVGPGTATWTNLTPIAPGAVSTLTITYSALAPPPGGDTVNRVHTASAIDVNADPAPDVAASASVNVADTRVSITKTRTSPDPIVVVGQAATYTVVVKNTGVSTLTTVPVTDLFEDPTLDLSKAIPAPSAMTSASLSWANVGPLTPGQQTTITIGFVATAPTSGRSTVDTATVAGATDSAGVVAGTVSATASVVVRWSAVITALSASDAPTTGSDVAVTSSVRNDLALPIANSTMTYVIWWDADGNGVFNTGDTYMDATGNPHSWDGLAVITSHVTSGISVAASGTWTEPSPWKVNNRFFPQQGTYRVTATWRESNGTLIDVKTTQFYSIPALGWPLFGLTVLAGTAFMWFRLPAMALFTRRFRAGAR